MSKDKNNVEPEPSQWVPPGASAPRASKSSGGFLGYPASEWIVALVIAVGFGGYFLFSSDDESTASDSVAQEEQREVVYNSSWDGSVRQVERWLESNLRDPDSLEVIDWSEVIKNEDGSFMVRCKYRAKNGFGGFVVNNKVFLLSSSGEVTAVTDYK